MKMAPVRALSSGDAASLNPTRWRRRAGKQENACEPLSPNQQWWRSRGVPRGERRRKKRGEGEIEMNVLRMQVSQKSGGFINKLLAEPQITASSDRRVKDARANANSSSYIWSEPLKALKATSGSDTKIEFVI